MAYRYDGLQGLQYQPWVYNEYKSNREYYGSVKYCSP